MLARLIYRVHNDMNNRYTCYFVLVHYDWCKTRIKDLEHCVPIKPPHRYHQEHTRIAGAGLYVLTPLQEGTYWTVGRNNSSKVQSKFNIPFLVGTQIIQDHH